jgi:(p)ppGpp synthase/HD superfamily hydrolase
MIFTTNHIKRAGLALIGNDEFKRIEAINDINTWRVSFTPFMQKLETAISQLLATQKITYTRASRIKRLPSIVDKLKVHPDRGLGTMQDIGGIRFIFDQLTDTYTAFNLILQQPIEGFELVKTYDYINGHGISPKESGYRSIHLVYKSVSEQEIDNNYKIEVQLRSRLQHSWAMAVETASLVTNSTLKADRNDQQQWRSFFRLISSIFARQENTAELADYKNLTHTELCKAYYQFFNKLKLVDQLQALSTSVRYADSINQNGPCICVLILDYEARSVQVKPYSLSNIEDANKQFTQIEQSYSESANKQILMASLEDMKQLPTAYPSYFLDTDRFFKELKAFEQSCQLVD